MSRLPDAMRLLLGALMVVTAIQYFLPFLRPVLPTTTWNDPMSVRLMTGFDKSGLMAVAMFIHRVGGALLLVNRAVPFALAQLKLWVSSVLVFPPLVTVKVTKPPSFTAAGLLMENEGAASLSLIVPVADALVSEAPMGF